VDACDREAFQEYRLHPEAKASPRTADPATHGTRGPPTAMGSSATRLARVGKEANSLADTADLIFEDDERAVE
jgi:hypothetical protein